MYGKKGGFGDKGVVNGTKETIGKTEDAKVGKTVEGTPFDKGGKAGNAAKGRGQSDGAYQDP